MLLRYKVKVTLKTVTQVKSKKYCTFFLLLK